MRSLFFFDVCRYRGVKLDSESVVPNYPASVSSDFTEPMSRGKHFLEKMKQDHHPDE
jgi:hypothetical protein